jgi:hypothetical protein
MPKHPMRRGLTVALLAMLASLTLTAGASASESLNLPPTYAKFDFCPVSNPENRDCGYSVTKGGSVTLGKKTVPIVNPVTLQGALGKLLQPIEQTINGYPFHGAEHFLEATNGITLSKTPEPVPGGLLGLVPPGTSPPAVKALTAFYSAHQASGVTATAEIAGPVFLSEFDTLNQEETALQMPVKIHLENPFFGSSCYIGSNSSPIYWNMMTNPSPPFLGSSGYVTAEAEDRIASIEGAQLVGNTWAAPGVTGCGGTLAPILDPLIDSAIGLPSAAGRNTVRLANVYLALSSRVNILNILEP